ncbi:MAG TPA: hypothetical protein VGU44_00170 [Gammaproteobacteria bacterium]|nr:hypothetical protein [Gammaproteobacteria bacterium]
MPFKSGLDELTVAQEQAKGIFSETQTRPHVLAIQNISIFGSGLKYSFKLIFEEKKILFFAILQCLIICIGYLLWIQILDWIPSSVVEEIKKAKDTDNHSQFYLLNLIFCAWSLLIVAVVSYLLSIFSAAITAAHYLKNSNQISTVAGCLRLALQHLGKLWIFTTIDAWKTVSMLLRRLPTNRRTNNMLIELAYYAWKIGTIGIQPALIAGKGYADAVKDSICLLTTQPTRTIGVRMGYSLICWIVGILAYVGSFFYYLKFGDHVNPANKIYHIAFTLTVPIFVAVGVILVLVRPFFLIMISKLYTDVILVNTEMMIIKDNTKFDISMFFFIVLLSTLLILYFFGEQLGLRQLIEAAAAKDVGDYLKSFKGLYKVQ